MAERPIGFKPALLIIDMQNDFTPPTGSLAVTGGRDIIPVINNLISLPRFVTRLATKDWHPQDHISFASNHAPPDNVPFTSFTTVVNPLNAEESYVSRLWPDHCVQNTEGSQLVDGLDPEGKIDIVIEKGTDPRVEMYSAFYDPFTNPRISDSHISERLRERDVNWVYVVGLAFDYCVRASALDAKKEGFEVVLVTNGTRAVDGSDENVKKVEDELRDAGIHVVDLGHKLIRWLH